MHAFGGGPSAKATPRHNGLTTARRSILTLCFSLLGCLDLVQASQARNGGALHSSVGPVTRQAFLTHGTLSDAGRPAGLSALDGQAVLAAGDERWTNEFGMPGIDGFGRVTLEFNGQLIVAGQFTRAGDTPASNIAAWDGSAWHALGDGLADDVVSLAIYQGELVAAGVFDQASGAPKFDIARWDGSHWARWNVALQGQGANIAALTVYDNKLVAPGRFTTIGGVSALNIAEWNGISWHALDNGFNNQVFCLLTIGPNLVAGGSFTASGSLPVAYVSRWDGVAWNALGSGFNTASGSATVRTLTIWNGAICAGGEFVRSGSRTVNHVAVWDDTSWQSLGSGVDESATAVVTGLTVHLGKLVATGTFSGAGRGIALWDGSWLPLGGGVGNYGVGLSVASFDGNLYLAGIFGALDSKPAGSIGRWNGSDWSSVGGLPATNGVDGYIRAMTFYRGHLVVAGQFSLAGEVPAENVAEWDGAAWRPLGAGLQGLVFALAVYQDKLIVGGSISKAGETSVGGLASWDGTSQSWERVGDATVGLVYALAEFNGKLHVGTDGSGVGVWDGATLTALPTSPNGPVRALISYDNSLVAGGDFTSVSGTAVGRIARWDGSFWSRLEAGVAKTGGASINSLAVQENVLYVGGDFTTANGVSTSNVAQWNGTAWSAMSSGINGEVYALVPFAGGVIAAGEFSGAGGAPSNNIAFWSGNAWSPQGSGVAYPGSVLAVTASGSDLYVGGLFHTAGGQSAYGLARLGGGPVPVELAYLTAEAGASGVTVSWKITSERNFAGFHVFRGFEESNRTRITGVLLHGGQTFEYTDDAPLPGSRYWIEAIDRNGAVEWFGPVNTSDDAVSPLPLVSLQSATPNPFRTTVSIDFHLTRPARAEIAVFDLRGRRVRTLAEESLSGGDHSVAWDGRGDDGRALPAGFYFVRIAAPTEAISRKLILSQ